MGMLRTERRWTWGAWATLAVIIVFALCSAGVAALVLRQPGEGCVVAHPGGLSTTVHACYGDLPTPLRPGDVLLTAGGLSLNIDDEDVWSGQPAPVGWAEAR